LHKLFHQASLRQVNPEAGQTLHNVVHRVCRNCALADRLPRRPVIQELHRAGPVRTRTLFAVRHVPADTGIKGQLAPPSGQFEDKFGRSVRANPLVKSHRPNIAISPPVVSPLVMGSWSTVIGMVRGLPGARVAVYSTVDSVPPHGTSSQARFMTQFPPLPSLLLLWLVIALGLPAICGTFDWAVAVLEPGSTEKSDAPSTEEIDANCSAPRELIAARGRRGLRGRIQTKGLSPGGVCRSALPLPPLAHPERMPLRI
jgi:hypothetical protein